MIDQHPLVGDGRGQTTLAKHLINWLETNKVATDADHGQEVIERMIKRKIRDRETSLIQQSEFCQLFILSSFKKALLKLMERFNDGMKDGLINKHMSIGR